MAVFSEQVVSTGDNRYDSKQFILQSSEESQAWQRFLPSTDELPEDREHFITHHRNERGQMVVTMTVRPREVAQQGGSADEDKDKPQIDYDKLSDADLETRAAQLGVDDYPLNGSRKRRVAAVRKADDVLQRVDQAGAKPDDVLGTED